MTDPVPWTFAAGGTVFEQYAWLTDVLPAPTGPEQTRRLRVAPRVTLGFEGMESSRNRRWMETLLNANGAGKWHAPLVMDGATLVAPLTAASTSVPFDTAGLRFSAGGRALLAANAPRHFEVVEIDTVQADRLELTTGTTFDWPAGARVVPLRTARLDAVPTLARFTGDDVPYEIAFRLEEQLEVAADAGAATYRTAPVLEFVPTWSSDPDSTAERQLLTVDEETGPVVTTDLVGIPLGKQNLSFTLVGLAEIAAFRGLLYALCGRWAPVWVPSLAQDLRVVATVANGATTLDVEHSGLSAWPLAINRRDIRLQLADGTVLYRRITAVAEQSAAVERLTLDSAIATGFAASAVTVVSFMALCRQDTDINKLIWWKHDTVLCDLTFRAVKNGL